ncbi:MAG TPA: hypothetical protein VIY90_12970 [Steroidobacteraceae bacterium]
MQYVTRLLGRAEKLRFFMDQESGLRAAFMARSAIVLRLTSEAALHIVGKLKGKWRPPALSDQRM